MGLYDQWQEKMTDDKGFFRGQYEGEDQNIAQFSDYENTQYGPEARQWYEGKEGGYDFAKSVERRLQDEGTYYSQGGDQSLPLDDMEQYEFEPKSGFYGGIGRLNDWRMNRKLRNLSGRYNEEAMTDPDMRRGSRSSSTEGMIQSNSPWMQDDLRGFNSNIPRSIENTGNRGFSITGDYMNENSGSYDDRALGNRDQNYMNRAEDIVSNRSQQPNNLLDMIKGIF